MSTIPWRNMVAQRGIGNVAKAIGVSNTAVHKYSTGLSVPRGQNMRDLVSFMRRTSSPADFKDFMASLRVEMFGPDGEK